MPLLPKNYEFVQSVFDINPHSQQMSLKDKQFATMFFEIMHE